MNILVIITSPYLTNNIFLSNEINKVEINHEINKPIKANVTLDFEAYKINNDPFLLRNMAEITILYNLEPVFRGVIDAIKISKSQTIITAYSYLQKFSAIIETSKLYENKTVDEIITDLILPPITYGGIDSFLHQYNSSITTQFQNESRLSSILRLFDSENAHLINTQEFDSELNAVDIITGLEFNLTKEYSITLRNTDITVSYKYDNKYYTGVVIEGEFGTIIKTEDNQLYNQTNGEIINSMYVESTCIDIETGETINSGKTLSDTPSFTMQLNDESYKETGLITVEFKKMNYCYTGEDYVGTLYVAIDTSKIDEQAIREISCYNFVLYGYDSNGNLVTVSRNSQNGKFEKDGVYFGKITERGSISEAMYYDIFIDPATQEFTQKITFGFGYNVPNIKAQNIENIAVFKKQGEFIIKHDLHINNSVIQYPELLKEIAIAHIMYSESLNNMLDIIYYGINKDIKLNEPIYLADEDVVVVPINIIYNIEKDKRYTRLKGYVPCDTIELEFVEDGIVY